MLELAMVGDVVLIGGARCVLEARVGPRVAVMRRPTGDFSLAISGIRGWRLDELTFPAKAIGDATSRAASVAAGLPSKRPARRKKRKRG